eukprot:5670306-Prymnesium_polylepis.1
MLELERHVARARSQPVQNFCVWGTCRAPHDCKRGRDARRIEIADPKIERASERFTDALRQIRTHAGDVVTSSQHVNNEASTQYT